MISKIYYLNLDKRTDKRAFIETQLSEFGISYERFPAILVNREDLLNPDGKYHEFYLRCNSHFKKSIESGVGFCNIRGIIGCNISTTLLYKEILNRDFDSNVLLLQDDCILKNGWYEILEEFFEKNLEFARNWDLLRCVWSQKRRKYIKKWNTNHKKNKGIHKNINEIYGGAHFTLVNSSKIKKIYKYISNNYVHQIDALYNTTELTVYHAKFSGKVDYCGKFKSDCNPAYKH